MLIKTVLFVKYPIIDTSDFFIYYTDNIQNV